MCKPRKVLGRGWGKELLHLFYANKTVATEINFASTQICSECVDIQTALVSTLHNAEDQGGKTQVQLADNKGKRGHLQGCGEPSISSHRANRTLSQMRVGMYLFDAFGD